jgi:class 3 adenylate cyclase
MRKEARDGRFDQEALADPGGICVSHVVRDQVRDRLAFSFEDMGEVGHAFRRRDVLYRLFDVGA